MSYRTIHKNNIQILEHHAFDDFTVYKAKETVKIKNPYNKRLHVTNHLFVKLHNKNVIYTINPIYNNDLYYIICNANELQYIKEITTHTLLISKNKIIPLYITDESIHNIVYNYDNTYI